MQQHTVYIIINFISFQKVHWFPNPHKCIENVLLTTSFVYHLSAYYKISILEETNVTIESKLIA